jgi:ankyrin repeat protein
VGIHHHEAAAMSHDLTKSELVALHQAYVRGDLAAIRALMGETAGFPNTRGPIAVGDIVLEYAIYWSPLQMIRALLDLGADPNYGDHAGFPSLIAALSTERNDVREILELLLAAGADIQQRGVKDHTPLHYAVGRRNLDVVALLLSHGASPQAKTRIDDCSTPIEDAEQIGFTEAAEMMKTKP